MLLRMWCKNGNERDLHGNNMIRKVVREDEVIRLMDGQEHVHYSLPQKYISISKLIQLSKINPQSHHPQSNHPLSRKMLKQ